MYKIFTLHIGPCCIVSAVPTVQQPMGLVPFEAAGAKSCLPAWTSLVIASTGQMMEGSVFDPTVVKQCAWRKVFTFGTAFVQL